MVPSQQFPRRWKEPRRQVIQEHRQEEIENQNDDERGHERLGGRSTDSFRSGSAVVSSMTTDEGDDRAKENRLDQSGKYIPGSNKFLRVRPVMVSFHMVDIHADHRSANDAHGVRQNRQ